MLDSAQLYGCFALDPKNNLVCALLGKAKYKQEIQSVLAQRFESLQFTLFLAPNISVTMAKQKRGGV